MGPTLGLALLLATLAQAPAADAIGRQLDSRDTRTVAWAAYNAGAYHRVEAIPRLQQLLESPPATGPFEERAFIAVLMDALIQLDAKLPARILVPHMQRHPVQTFVLLSRATDREGVLLDLLPQLTSIQWFAAANLLFEDRSPGLVEHLARTVKLQLTVHVADDEHLAPGAGHSVSVGIACGIGQDPPAYPPHAEYRFVLGSQPGTTVLAPGPHPVYYSRTVTTSLQYGVSEATTGGPSGEDRMEYLRAMSIDRGGVPFRAHSMEIVVWSTPEAFSQRVRELRAGVARRFQYLVDEARRSRAVPIEPLTPPLVELHVVDRRKDQSAPLPKIDR